jgi:hypothetical protein
MTQRRVGPATLLGTLAAFALAPAANAQAPGSITRPPYSPYLNLARPGNPALNYYGLVRPEIDWRNSVGNLQTEFSALNQELNNPVAGNPAFPSTGHPVTFLNYSHFYYGVRGGRPPLIGYGGNLPANVGAPSSYFPSTGRLPAAAAPGLYTPGTPMTPGTPAIPGRIPNLPPAP